MNLEDFTAQINALWDNGDEKNAALLTGEHPRSNTRLEPVFI